MGACPIRFKQRLEMTEQYDKFAEVCGHLKRVRDELALQMHLGSKEAQAEWGELEGKFKELMARAEIDQSVDEIEDAMTTLGRRLKTGYERLAKALSEKA